jgi:murein DD-endopeptidase MepM/ murein hydrolase activator NlpD
VSIAPVVTGTQSADVGHALAMPTAVDLPSFKPISPEELAATNEARVSSASPEVTVVASPTTMTTPTQVPTPTKIDTPTPLPTFTPPSLPMTSVDEHYWLRRPIADGGVVWTDKSYPYGHTRGGTLRPHHGVEFYVAAGTDVLSAASGIVRVAGSDEADAFGPDTNFYGKLVVIELDSRRNGQLVFNLYGHLSETLVEVGQHVQAQEMIARSGASGVADGPHLHFEVRVGQNMYENTRNPLLWLYPFPNRGTVAGRAVWPNGELVNEAPIRLQRIDAPSRYAVTTTYAASGVNSDDGWQENFALDDVEAGYYQVVVDANEVEYSAEVWVFPYQTSFVEIVIGATSRPSEP